VAQEIEVDGPLCVLSDLADLPADRIGAERRGNDPRAPTRATLIANAAPLDPAIGACTIGTSMPRASVNLVFISFASPEAKSMKRTR
jgi:hypothetical protein